MRRGRIFIYLALIIIFGVAAVALFLWTRRTPSRPSTGTQNTPQVRLIEIITAGQNIDPGTPIKEEMLSTIQIPEDKLVEGLYTNKTDLVDMYAKYPISQGVPITSAMVTSISGNVNLPGSSWAPFIPMGYTAVAVPMTRLSSVAYGIRDGDYVDIIVTMLLVDIDPTSQSLLPNKLADLTANSDGSVSIKNGDVIEGHFEIDEVSNKLIYVQPSEKQRPRMVSQMILQNIRILHVGSFPLAGESGSDQLAAAGSNKNATPTPVAAGGSTTEKPDIITLMVLPQDAVTMTYLIYNGAQLTLTLRNPNDQKSTTQPEAANLEYLLTQYNIPIPAKLPYSIEPAVSTLSQPRLPNDVPIPTPRP